MDTGSPPSPNERQPMKGHMAMKILARILMSMSLIIFTFEIIATTIVAKYSGPMPCGIGMGIWSGILGIITAGLGLGAFERAKGSCQKCLMVSHFVMCIIMTLADISFIVMTTFCKVMMPQQLKYVFEGLDKESMIELLTWIEFFMWSAGMTHCKCNFFLGVG
jgi:hypothetical protein